MTLCHYLFLVSQTLKKKKGRKKAILDSSLTLHPISKSSQLYLQNISPQSDHSQVLH